MKDIFKNWDDYIIPFYLIVFVGIIVALIEESYNWLFNKK